MGKKLEGKIAVITGAPQCGLPPGSCRRRHTPFSPRALRVPITARSAPAPTTLGVQHAISLSRSALAPPRDPRRG